MKINLCQVVIFYSQEVEHKSDRCHISYLVLLVHKESENEQILLNRVVLLTDFTIEII